MEAFFQQTYVKNTVEYGKAILGKPWMKDLVIVVSTLAVLGLVAFGYLKLKPTVVIPPPGVISKCPARWVFNTDTSECEPQYSTKCKAFNPNSVSDVEKCDIVKACGTYWKGLCNY